MKTRALWKVGVATTAEAEEAVEELLAAVFRQPVVSYTNAETRRTLVTVYLNAEPDARETRRRLKEGLENVARCGLAVGEGKISVGKVRREDWAESWKRHFHPIAVSETLLIKPSWSRRRPRKGQKIVVLDPGLSFGTGQHPTTGFCLEQLAQLRRNGERQALLDAGCGSGILAIAAAKIGYAPVGAFDFDPEAVRVARMNARKNRVERKVRFSQQDLNQLPVKTAKRYSVVCANLISSLLISARKRLLARVEPGGALIVAGILDVEFAQVQKVYEAMGLRLVASQGEGEWRSGTFLRQMWKNKNAGNF